MHLMINGERRAFDDLSATSTVAELLTILGLKSDRVAIERNGEIVSRPAWNTTVLAEEDRMEIVHFVGGGFCCSQ
jgi:thiamine biosynthesis protein ThiS